ncbi:putative amino acid permease family protein [Penicillium brasilianum]|uniref:Putative Amino acid transporter n=1 Tax=Penicillium brasilianum TaxID=104259 RepID=A0A0F7TY05_PENBI|nr:putative amino acid permease family protein [Penicillium brasilianum]CEJ61533.1 Putative Amino acid transporter [Penicillium brasilianum]
MDVESHSPLKVPLENDQDVQDATDLAGMGHAQALTRKFSIWSMLALAFCVLGTYSTFAQDLSSGLTNGGPITILWGLVLVTGCNLCVALSLGELTSSMPTALGQAYWVYRLWTTPLGRFVSYMCAWINTFGWWTLTASQVAFMTEFMLGMKTMFNPDWTGGSQGWLNFVVFIGVVFLLTVINVVSCRREQILPWINNFVGVWFAGLFVVMSLVMLICVGVKSDLSFQSGKFVFGTWINQTGWSDGVTWFTGLVQAAYGLTAFDSVIHMVEEIPNPRRNAPRVIWMAVLFGAITGFIFMVVCLFCIQNVDNVTNADLPFMELMLETVGLKGGTVLLAFFIFNGVGQSIGILTTASRLTWGFARDGGLPFSRYFSHVDPVWQVPARALWGQGVIVAIVGILYLFANTVLEAILSVSTIALTISYAMPILALLVVGRDKLPDGGSAGLGRWGPWLNWISIVYCIITTVFFLFPGEPNPAPSDMNYAIAVFGVMLVIAVAFWFIQGSRTYLQTDDAVAQMFYAQHLENAESAAEPRSDADSK